MNWQSATTLMLAAPGFGCQPLWFSASSVTVLSTRRQGLLALSTTALRVTALDSSLPPCQFLRSRGS